MHLPLFREDKVLHKVQPEEVMFLVAEDNYTKSTCQIKP